MSISTNFTTRSIAILVFCCLLAVPVAFGSGGGGNSSGSSGTGNGGGDRPALHVSEATYELGKKVFHENVVCDSCIYAGLEQTPESVSETWRKIKKDLRKSGEIGSGLTRKERKSVKLFMRKRFDL